jgi:ABC-type Fe3+ transport system permease subunit
LTVSVLLYVPGRETIGVIVLNAEQGGDLASTSAIALLLTIAVFLCAVPLVASRRLRTTFGFSAGGAL